MLKLSLDEINSKENVKTEAVTACYFTTKSGRFY